MITISESHAWRQKLLGLAFAVFCALIIGQLIRLQVFPHTQTIRARWGIFTTENRTITPPRGLIYDRWGNLMAGNRKVYEVGVELRHVKNPQTIAHTLNSILGISYERLYELASVEHAPDRVYRTLAMNVTEEQKDEILRRKEELEAVASRKSKDPNPPSMSGLVITPTRMRSYPEKEVASNVIGFVNVEGEGFGIEKKFHDLLSGVPVKVAIPLDPNRAAELPEIPPGSTLILTLDREIQAAMEQVLDNTVKQNGASGGTIAVMDPKTGEILAMATTPRIDLNDFSRHRDIFPEGRPFNPAVSMAYEPGSVYKVLTMAAALDSGIVTPDTIFVDTGVFEIGGIVIRNWNWAGFGPQDMQGCMQHSLNVCMSWLAVELGTDRFYSYMDAFGIGRLTGIEIAGESAGRLKKPGDGDWYMADLATNSFGQGVSATPVQMLMAVSAIANEGKMMAPHIVRSVVSNGYQYNTTPQVVGTPITADTARTLSELLARSLEKEASTALVSGYRLAGKTGTAQIPTPSGYHPTLTHASFVGWGPVDDPQFLVYIWLERPTSSPWASIVASPVFSDVVKRLVVLMNIPPDDVRYQLNALSGN
jgi:cell division protein FtsI/penicillin-binding protein 2